MSLARIKPKFTYCGLTIVLSQPSRFDQKEGKLLAGNAGYFFNQECLRPECNILQCDVRISDTKGDGLLEGTKAILLLGARAFHEWAPQYKEYSLGEQRGCPLRNEWNLPCIASFTPQDACDLRDWESVHNEQVIEYEEENEKDNEEDAKTKGGTSRKNYRFWLLKDCKKILKRLVNTSEVGEYVKNQSTIIYPQSGELLKFLTTLKSDYLYVDIETDSLWQCNCIGLASERSPIYVVPMCRYNYLPAYDNLEQILQALAMAFRDNCVVCHNSMFDLLVLAWKYRIPCGRNNYDTMLAWHRMYPEAEKSLGHVMSALTWMEYHKDEGMFEPKTVEAEKKLWEYNAKDVSGTREIRRAIDEYAKTQPGLTESISQSNACIRPYLINSLMGIKYDNDKLAVMFKENDRLMTQYVRIIKLLLGKELYAEIQGKSNSNLPASPKQCVKYFHSYMGYKQVAKTKAGEASLAADSMYRLKLRHPENVIIDLVLAYRERAKESGSLKFTPWIERKDSDATITRPTN